MNSKTKQCQNCKADFTIEPEDFEFYKKIDVPEPTFCPECRMQRRMTFLNTIGLYKRKCDFSGEDMISIYRSDSPYKIYHNKVWWSDKWDALEYGKDYDFKKPFFEQFKELMLAVPRAHNFNLKSINCDYCAATYNSKNCYLSVCNTCEDCAYANARQSKNCFDGYAMMKCESCYEDIFCEQNYNLHFSQYSDNCIDSAFLFDCRSCQNCFGCVNLRHKKYHIFNKPYSKTEYQKEIKKYDLGDYKNIEKIKKQFNKFEMKFPKRFARVYKAYNIVGDNIRNTNNCYHCFSTGQGVEDCKYIYSGGANLKDSYDIFSGGVNAELTYEGTVCGDNLRRVFFSNNVADSVYNIEYSNECYASSGLFGCVCLRHKKNCILNKQYTKKEYDKLIPRIKKHMAKMPYIDKKGREYKYGEFFPIELSPFDYNKSSAQEFYPLTKKEALAQGYSWYDAPVLEYKPTIMAKDLPNHIKDVDKSILKEIIGCSNPDCIGIGIYRIIPNELKFYKRQNISLPRFCSECRRQERVAQKNPIRLWKRRCMKKGCNTEFETSYAPDRKETVYCESCYLKEIG